MADQDPVLQHPKLADAVLVHDTELNAQRGRHKQELIQFNSQELDAIVTGNNISSTVNGNNAIGKDAFTNSQGHISVIQNSGNNVIIQDTTIYNITFIN